MDYSKAYKGIFKPKHPHKYKGDPTNIIYRSSWEKQCMIYFDNKPDIVQWQSEEWFIPYRHPITGRIHRYFPDFVIKNTKDQVYVIEVKPYKQTQEPKIQKKKTRRYLTEVKTFAINTYKWKAAREYCAARKWEFVILTEKELKI
tara:strand:- start:820 stop:1254 length:435 start_codon:yes stop_codon:yes gene_type:complete